MKKYIQSNLNNIVYKSGTKSIANIDIDNLSSYVTGEDMNDLSGCLYNAISALNNLYLPSDTR